MFLYLIITDLCYNGDFRWFVVVDGLDLSVSSQKGNQAS